MIYIGRSSYGLHFGNPFSHNPNSIAEIKVTTREEAVDCFDDWINGRKFQEVEPERREWILNNLNMLTGKDLVCWCAPLRCHGEILMKLLGEG